MNNSHTTHDTALHRVERIVALFKMERIVHLVITSLSLVMLLFSAGWIIVKTEADIKILAALFGSTGLIGYSANRLLRMFDQAVSLLNSSK